ncbi:hypothetical protein [Embleya sp. NPDC001921]
MAPVAMFELLEAGPDFTGWFGEVERKPACVLPALVLTEPAVQTHTQIAARRQNRDCGACVQAACPLFRLAPQ